MVLFSSQGAPKSLSLPVPRYDNQKVNKVKFSLSHSTRRSQVITINLGFNVLLTVHHAVILGNCPT